MKAFTFGILALGIIGCQATKEEPVAQEGSQRQSFEAEVNHLLQEMNDGTALSLNPRLPEESGLGQSQTQ